MCSRPLSEKSLVIKKIIGSNYLTLQCKIEHNIYENRDRQIAVLLTNIPFAHYKAQKAKLCVISLHLPNPFIF